MTRRTKEVRIPSGSDSRDQGKVYVIHEMSALRAEKWAARALLALVASGVSIPDDVAASGMAGVAAMGVGAFKGVAFDALEPLMDEMLGCVSFKPDPRNPQVERPLDIEQEDVEELSTLMTLRMEVLEIHTGFSVRDSLSQVSARLKSASPPPNTQTSAAPSEPSSEAA